MKHAKHNGTAYDETHDDMLEAHRLLRKGTDASLAVAPVGFGARMVATGYARLAPLYDAWLDAIEFIPKPEHAALPLDPAPLTVELRLKEVTNFSIGHAGPDDAITLGWQTPLGRMELALYDDDPDPGE